MTDFILSTESELLIQKLHEMDPGSLFSKQFFGEVQSREQVIEWLMLPEGTPIAAGAHARFSRELLRARLLADLLGSEGIDEVVLETDTTWFGKFKLAVLALAGTIYNICNGFDGSVSILTLFIGIPSWTVFVVGFILSLVFVVLFYNLELITMSDNLKIGLYASRQILDSFVEQAELIDLLMKQTKQRLREQNNILLDDLLHLNVAVNQENFQDNPNKYAKRFRAIGEISATSRDLTVGSIGCDVSLDNIDQASSLLATLNMLAIRQLELASVQQLYLQELEEFYIKLLKFFMVAITGLLFFNFGFFAGQSFALVVLAAFLTASITATSWPVLLISIGVGVTSLLSMYWFSERFNVENVVCRWLGLDVDKINQLPDDATIENELIERAELAKQVQLESGVRNRFLFVSSNTPGVDSSPDCGTSINIYENRRI